MPQQEKITRKLDFDKRAQITGHRIKQITANFTVDELVDSGTTFVLSNASVPTYRITLPLVNACNGQVYHFYNRTLLGVEVTGDTNSIVSQRSINATHSVLALNISGASNIGASWDILNDGTYHYFMPSTQSNIGIQYREI